ncbi:MAG: bile acid:sodium symporter [Candidatus Acidiferrales bacterium]
MKTAVDFGVLAVTLALMFTVGLELETCHFKELARNKRTFFAALIGQMVVSPAIGVFIVRTIPLPEYLQVGILLVAACPVGDIANFYTLMARGNVALSVAVNAVSCLLSVASMSVIFGFYRSLFGAEFALSVPPFRLLGRLILMVAVPIVAGMVFRVLRSELVSKVSRNLRTLCVGGILALCMFVIVNRHAQLRADWKAIWLSSLSLMAVAMAFGWAIGLVMNLKRADSITFVILFPVRNIAIAAAIAVTLMGRLEYAAFATAYFLSEALLLLGVVAIVRYRSSVAPPTNSAPEGAIQP